MTTVTSHSSIAAPGKKVAIVQSNYIPWKGYFDLIASVDEFILLDDVQYTRRDWRNRNVIKARQGPMWLTIPVNSKGNYHEAVKNITVSSPDWNLKHWKGIEANYSRAKYFRDYKEFFEQLYLRNRSTMLSEINYTFLRAICDLLAIGTRITWSMDYGVLDGKGERLVDLCLKAGASEYISGPAAKYYIRQELFDEASIALTYFDYSGYPEYDQLFPPFEHRVSIIDLILNTGPYARQFMKA